MSEKTKKYARSATASTSFDDQELRATMDAYLSNEPKQNRSVWNFSTITGLSLLFVGMSYTAQTIIGNTLGLSIGPDLSNFIQVLPFIGGIILAVTGIGLASKERRKTRKEKKARRQKRGEVTQKQEDVFGSGHHSYGDDKLDDYLYPNKKEKDSSSLFSRSDSYAFSLQKKLFRSRSNKKIAGVCAGIAKYFDVSPNLVRFIFVIATLLGYGSFILVYIAMMIVIPKEPVDFLDF